MVSFNTFHFPSYMMCHTKQVITILYLRNMNLWGDSYAPDLWVSGIALINVRETYGRSVRVLCGREHLLYKLQLAQLSSESDV